MMSGASLCAPRAGMRRRPRAALQCGRTLPVGCVVHCGGGQGWAAWASRPRLIHAPHMHLTYTSPTPHIHLTSSSPPRRRRGALDQLRAAPVLRVRRDRLQGAHGFLNPNPISNPGPSSDPNPKILTLSQAPLYLGAERLPTTRHGQLPAGHRSTPAGLP